MKFSCPICTNKHCQIVVASKNESLARYGFLKSVDSPPLSMGLDQQVAYCQNCNFAWNTVFEYNKIKYDSDQIIEAGHFSKRYIEYQKYSASYLRKLMGFKPDTIVEIGAGAGIFIKGFEAKRKIAIEPSDEAKQIDSSVEVFNEYYIKDKFNFPADIVVLRQVLEHLKDPLEFLQNLKASFDSGEKFYIYIEVPNATLTFRFGRFYDYYYEHCNYFSLKTFNTLAEKLNMEIIDISTAMDGELLSVLMTNENLSHQSLINSIDINRSSIINELNKKISDGAKILAWGASGNGVQILNNLKINIDLVEYVIDSDINKQGKFIPGTLQKIISSEEAIAFKPDVILVLTQFHKAEIGLTCERLFPNSKVWFIN